MVVQDIKPIVKGIAQLQYILSGGIAVYHLNAVDWHVQQIEIDLSDKHDVGETAAFKPVEKGVNTYEMDKKSKRRWNFDKNFINLFFHINKKLYICNRKRMAHWCNG